MNNDTFIQVWFIIILSIYGYTRVLPVPVLEYPYRTRTRKIATRTRNPNSPTIYEGVSVEPRRQSLEPPPPDVPWYRSCRVLLAFITAWGYVFFYLLRIDLSLAIICMVRDPDTAAGYDNSSHSGNGSIASVRLLFISLYF